MSAIPLRRIEGKYEILDKLGEGGMGAVYKVRHRLLDDVRVIKMMRPQLVANEEFKARFQREAKLAIRLRHPNIAHLIDFTIDEEDGTAFIVMEFIDGMTLEEMLRNAGPPPLGLALEIGQQSLRALTCLHEKEFVHRDISPDNLMLTQDADGQPLVKLIDLGIAKVLDSGLETANLTGTGIFLGKVRYSPPEQFGTEGASQVGARGDLYSFGIVLYELLTGRYPIQGRDAPSVMAGHLFHPPVDFAASDPEGRIPPALRAVVLRALAKNPAERFASARELGRALADLRSPGDIAASDLQRALTRLPTGTLRVPLTPPGSTQNRLDLQFGLATTPSRRAGPNRTETPGLSRQAVLDAAALIERHVQHGDLLTAETELQWAVDTFGEQARLAELRVRLQQRRAQELELRVQALVREAEGLFARQDFEGALERLHRGKALAPGNAAILARLEKAEAMVRQQRLSRDIAGVREEIEAALARSDYRAAERRLYEAEAIHGEQEALSVLHRRLGDLRRRDLEARVRIERLATAVRGIEVALGRGELDEAERLLDQAAATCGTDGMLADLQGRLGDLRQAARRAEAMARVEAAAERFGASDLEGALATARQALELDPDFEPTGALIAEVEAEMARRAEEEHRAAREAEIGALLEAAQKRRAQNDLDGALAEVRKVLDLDAENAAARSLLAEIEDEIEAADRRREEAARRAEQLATAAAAIDGRLAAGDLGEAEALLAEAFAAHGEEQALVEFRPRLEGLRRAVRDAEIAARLEKARERRDEGDLEGSLAEVREALALDAEYAAARSLLAEIAAGVEAERRRREEEARRAEQLAAAVAGIEGRLAVDDLAGAESLLAEAVAAQGDVVVLESLRSRLRDLQQAAQEAEIASLLDQARACRAGDDLEGALTAARRILALEAGHAAASTLIAEVEAERRRRQEEARRAEQLAAALASIDACLDRQDPEGAAKLLPGIVAVFGDRPSLRERFEQIEGLRRHHREQQATRLLEQARALVSRGDPDAAANPLREAARLLPNHPEVQAVTAELEAELRRREEERRIERELSAVLLSIDACLENGNLAGAARLLPGAVATFGGAAALRDRWERLELLQRKARAEALHAEAAALLEAGHTDRAARKLRQAAELDPDNRSVADLLADLSRR